MPFPGNSQVAWDRTPRVEVVCGAPTLWQLERRPWAPLPSSLCTEVSGAQVCTPSSETSAASPFR